TDISGTVLKSISRQCMDILRAYFPDYSTCVYDVKTSSYKITSAPDPSDNRYEPNKNTCIHVYGDGSFRLQGKPSRMPRVCSAFRDALLSVSESRSWNSFVNNLRLVEQ
ncbi:uncharacterized protein PV06_11919, partial [Exophiala oligosperma]